ncbi:hypothetical protein EST38_g3982 [Candolleomyces aberdarensis]|uniref:VOC domain-containing protein n=1 Tax=Candolleomyces aberdarensis TaxID=2316362 RepID=A0A4Q2DQV5_9AGAR|nr:hypothetical protein EST38_g3982 [Candolleomyces aberdarensis]
MPIAHLTIHTKDLEKITSFYEAALAPLDYTERMRFHDGAVRGYGASGYNVDFWVISMEDSNVPEEFKGKPIGGWGGPVHIAFHCKTRNQVRAFYDAAMYVILHPPLLPLNVGEWCSLFLAFRANGAKCNGPPGLRPQYFPAYYGAFVWDAEGRNIEAVCVRPGFWAEEWGVLGWTGVLSVAAAGAGYLWQNYFA